MRLFTFYNHVPLHDQVNELKMLNLWREHHRRLGFDPFVLQEYHAWTHPRHDQFMEAVGKLPSINPAGYDLACYQRWLAVANTGADYCIMMDYDCFLTPTVPDDLNPVEPGQEPNRLAVFQNTTPCLVAGSAKAFEQACVWFANCDPAGRKHLSDMIILEEVATKEPEAFHRWHFAKCYGEQYWKAAPAVHFSNACMSPAEKQPRWKWIPELLKEHTHQTYVQDHHHTDKGS